MRAALAATGLRSSATLAFKKMGIRKSKNAARGNSLKGSRMLRKGRMSQAGALYFISAFKADHARYLDNPGCFRIIENTLNLLEREGLLEWLALVLMPDHLHMIIRLGDRDSLSDAIRKFKSVSAIEINRQRGTSGPVWYKGFYDRFIREGENLAAYLNYIIMNPVKKRLCSKASDYEFLKIKRNFREQARSHN